MAQRTVGRRASYWRERRGVSQRELAIRLGRSASWMRKVESGERALERLPVLDAVAEALRVDVRVLLGRELVRDGDMCPDGVEVAAIRRALERYDHLLAADAGAVVDRGRLRIGVHYAWVAFAGTDYGTLGRTLPHLIDRAQAVVAGADGERRGGGFRGCRRRRIGSPRPGCASWARTSWRGSRRIVRSRRASVPVIRS
ncbi:helix-turn-helix domain-containing protein [Embleya sp. NPDC001921]